MQRDLIQFALVLIAISVFGSSVFATAGVKDSVYLDQDELWTVYGEAYQVPVSGDAETFYGDELGYTGEGVGDVNGDGYDDIALVFYRARTADNTKEKAGRVEIRSGFDGSLIGSPIEGDKANIWLAHSVGHVHTHGQHNTDLDDDGRSEIIMSTTRRSNNVGESLEGAVYVWAFSDKYNKCPTDTTEQWANILMIEGDGTGLPNSCPPETPGLPRVEFGFHVLSSDGDYNDDGVFDLLVGSRYYRDECGPRNDAPGAAWIFLMPEPSVFAQHVTNNQLTTSCTASGTVGPIVMTHLDYSVFIESGQSTDPWFGTGLANLGDLDGDGGEDFSVAGHLHGHGSDSEVGKVYLFLSTSGVRSGEPLVALDPNDPTEKYYKSPIQIDENDAVIIDSTIQTTSFTSADADFVLIGESEGDEFGKTGVAAADFTGDGDMDLAASGGDEIYVYEIASRIDDYITTNDRPTSQEEWVVSETVANGGADLPVPKPHSSYGFWELERVAGDMFGEDGDFELIAYSSLGTTKHVMVIVDIEDTGTTLEESYPLEFVGESTSSVPNGRVIDGNGSEGGFDYTPKWLRAWPAWNMDDDGRTDIFISCSRYPLLIPGITDAGDHCNPQLLPEHTCTGHDPYVIGGSIHVFQTVPSVITSLTNDCGELGEQLDVTIVGENLQLPYLQSTFSPSDVEIEYFKMEIVDSITITGTPVPVENETTGLTEVVFTFTIPSSGLNTSPRDITLNTLVGPVVLEDAFTVLSSGCRSSVIDTNNDGIVGVDDLNQVLDDWGKDGIESPRSDVNGDGVVDTEDVRLVVQALQLRGLISQ